MDISNKSQNLSRKKNGGTKGIITPLATIYHYTTKKDFHPKGWKPER
jgi:hypothetical protein